MIVPQGSICPLWRDQVVANPAQASTITAGGGSGTNTVTVGTGLVGLVPGVLVTFSVGTAEPGNTVVLNYNTSTGVVTFAANLTNAHASGNLLFGYQAPIYDGAGGFNESANGAQGPLQPAATPSPTYGVNQAVRDWDLQLRQQNIYT